MSKIMRNPALLRGISLIAKSLFNLADAARAGELFFHLSFILALVCVKFGIIYLGKSLHAIFIFFFRNRFVGREAVDMIATREE